MSSSPYPLTLVNGQLTNEISVNDRGLSYGDGLFETMLVVQGEIPLWTYHETRIKKGLHKLGINIDSDLINSVLSQNLLHARSAKHELFVLKLILTRGVGGRGYQADPKITGSLVSLMSPYTVDSSKFNGVEVHTCKHKLNPVDWPGLKTLNQLPYVLASQERVNTSYDEGLLYSNNGKLIEATSRNIFIVKNDLIVTPRISDCGVEGVFRNFIIDKVAKKIGCTVKESELSKDTLFEADEVFLTNSISGIWPVIKCEELSWVVGPVTRSLQSICNSTFINQIS